VDECKHYYSGFKLLFLDVRVSSGIVWKVLNGYTLSRRESRYGLLLFAGSFNFKWRWEMMECLLRSMTTWQV
jgi:hypothetical protein